jgi:tetratricopeptide (TPR) repeat protein
VNISMASLINENMMDHQQVRKPIAARPMLLFRCRLQVGTVLAKSKPFLFLFKPGSPGWCSYEGIRGILGFGIFFLFLAAEVASQKASGPLVTAPSLKSGVQALFAGDYPKAEAAARSQLKTNSRSPEALVLLARVQMAQGKYQPAYAALRKALISSPSNEEALYFLGKLTSALSQMEYQQLARLAPGSARLRQLTGDHYQASGEIAKAEEEYQAALAADPGLLEIAVELGEMLRTQGRFEDALRYYGQVLEKDPGHFTSLFGAGMCYQALHQVKKTAEFLEQAARAQPGDAETWMALGNAWIAAGNSENAVAALREATRLDPDLRLAHTLLGRCLQQLGRPEEAAREFEKARLLMEKELEQQRQKTRKLFGVPEGK